jgi:hypothetical protein
VASVPRGTEAGGIGNDDSGGTDSLGVSYFLGEGASSSVDHEDVGRWPGEHVAVFILCFFGVASSGIAYRYLK